MPVPTDIRGYLGWRTAYRLLELELEKGQPAVAGIPTVVPLQWGCGRLPHWIPLGNREVTDSVADAHTVAGIQSDAWSGCSSREAPLTSWPLTGVATAFHNGWKQKIHRAHHHLQRERPIPNDAFHDQGRRQPQDAGQRR